MSEKDSLLGRVLLIAVDGALRPSRVVGVSGNKLEHENLEGVTGHMALKRALWVSQHRCDSTAALAEYWEHVSTAGATLDLAALWNATTHADRSGPEEPAAILERAERPAGPPAASRGLTLIVTGDTRGELFPCGCRRHEPGWTS